ncbi:MAG: leucine-rich repeat protein [Clostridia bacterium]|nr:leucine-rich repeat protein [Clostridia bacterium]
MKKLVFALILALAAALCFAALADDETFTSGLYTYHVLDDGTAELLTYSGSESTVTLPAYIGGYPVTSLAMGVINNNSGVLSIVIPEGVTSVQDGAFYANYKLTSVIFPSTITYVGGNPFRFCTALEKFTVQPDHAYLATIDNVLFSKPDRRLICYPKSLSATSYEIPRGIRIIGMYAFAECSQLTNITIPDTVTTLEGNAFYSCSGLSRIDLPDSIVSVTGNAFRSCSGLPPFDIPASHPGLRSVDGVLFCTATNALVSYPVSLSYTSYAVPAGTEIIADFAFYGNRSLNRVTIPAGVHTIDHDAFAFCSEMTAIDIPAGVRVIGASAFANCRSLKSVAIPEGVTELGYRVFAEAGGLESVSLPESLLTIGRRCFYNCSALTSVTIPGSVTVLGEEAFYNCSKLESVTIPESVTFFGLNLFTKCSDNLVLTVWNDSAAEAFARDNNLSVAYQVKAEAPAPADEKPEEPERSRTFVSSGEYDYWLYDDGTIELASYRGSARDVTFPSVIDGHRVTAVGEGVINNSSVTSVTIPEGVTTIAEAAFYANTALARVTLPDSVTYVGKNPFRFCDKLDTFVVSQSHAYLATIDGVLFSKPDRRLICFPKNKSASSYEIPQGIRIVGSYAFAECSQLQSIRIPDSVTVLEDNAFFACTSLTSVDIPYSVTDITGNAFRRCTGLPAFNIPGDHPYLASIDGVLFVKADRKLVSYPTALTAAEYTVPYGIRTIADFAFYDNESLRSVTIPETVTYIGVDAFYSCNNLSSVTIPEGVTEIMDYAFSSTALTEVVLPETLTTIGAYAFAYDSLKSINIPDSVTFIGDYAFDGNGSLTVTVNRDSYARKYCQQNNINCTVNGGGSLDWLLD